MAARALQTTLRKSVTVEGVALHSGAPVRISLHPAAAGAGIAFRRVDLPGTDNIVAADPRHVVEARLGVRLRNAAGAEAMTVEHFLGAASLLGLDNAIVDLDGLEAPIFDGSLKDFAALIERAGLVEQQAERRTIAPGQHIRVEDGDRFIEIHPGPMRRIEATIDFVAPAIGRRSIVLDLDDPRSRARIIAARTFCTLGDIEGMRASGRGLGGSLGNAIVVDGARILNEGPLRDPDEFVLHKVADIVGDLALLGAPVIGTVRAHKSGHELHTRLAMKIGEMTGRQPATGNRQP